jgi:alpha-tubulin suppressor-like RCC1 family protein
MILNEKGKFFLFGRNEYGQLGDGTTITRNTPIFPSIENDNVIKIAAGQYHSVFLKNDGRVFTIGRNDVN